MEEEEVDVVEVGKCICGNCMKCLGMSWSDFW
jgi:hypothetical protein